MPAMPNTIFVREGLDRSLVVTDHNRNLHKTPVVVNLISRGQKHEIGRQLGTDAGIPFVIALDFSVPPPGNYVLEVMEEGGPILYPQDETIQEIEVVNVESNDT